MNNFIFGKYIPGHSVIHKMNPGSKLLLSVVFIITTLFADEWRGNLILLILVLATIAAAGISPRTLYRGLKPLLLIVVATSLLQLLFSPNGKVIWRWGVFSLTWTGVDNSWLVFMRFLLIILMSTLLTLSTPPMAIANGLKQLLAPLKRLKIPVNTIALMISVALRFIPTLTDELATIVKAQKARGMDFKAGTWLQRSKKVVALLIPLLFSAFNRAQKLSYAMISRGYQSDAQRSRYHVYSWHLRDSTVWLIYVFFSVIVLLCRK